MRSTMNRRGFFAVVGAAIVGVIAGRNVGSESLGPRSLPGVIYDDGGTRAWGLPYEDFFEMWTREMPDGVLARVNPTTALHVQNAAACNSAVADGDPAEFEWHSAWL